MIGAIAGDIVGSRWEGSGRKDTAFDLFNEECRFTDDSVLSIAVADCLLNGGAYAPMFHLYYERYTSAGYGSWFAEWARSRSDSPYGSFGNGGAMRVVPVGWAFDSEEDVLREAERSAAVTHDHPEGVKGAQAVALAVFLARSGVTKDGIRNELERRFDYDLSRRLDEIRPSYSFDVTAAGSVPEAIIAFLESDDWESAVRNAISLGGDADTMACIAGGIAEACHGLPPEIAAAASNYLDEPQRSVVAEFHERFVDGRGRSGQSGALAHLP